jgi:hypothetical protein
MTLAWFTHPEVHYVAHQHNQFPLHHIVATLDYRSIHHSISPLALIVYVAANTRHCECKDNKGRAPAVLII